MWGAPPGHSRSYAGWADQIPSRNLLLPRQHTGQGQHDPDESYRRILRCDHQQAKWNEQLSGRICIEHQPLRAQSGHCTGCEDHLLYSAWRWRRAQTWAPLHCSMMWDGLGTKIKRSQLVTADSTDTILVYKTIMPVHAYYIQTSCLVWKS